MGGQGEAGPPLAEDRAANEIARAEEALYRAMVARDFAALDALLADDLTYIHSTAVRESKGAYLRGIAEGLYEYEAIRSSGVTIERLSDFALQTGTVEMCVGERGRAKEWIDLIFTLAWRREARRWRLVLRQATRRPA